MEILDVPMKILDALVDMVPHEVREAREVGPHEVRRPSMTVAAVSKRRRSYGRRVFALELSEELVTKFLVAAVKIDPRTASEHRALCEALAEVVEMSLQRALRRAGSKGDVSPEG